MDDHTFRVLEFSKVLEMAAVSAMTTPGRDAVMSTHPLTDVHEIRKRISLVSESRKLLSMGRSFGIEHFDDPAPLLHKVRPDDAVLTPVELRSLLPLFYSSLNLKLLSDDPEYPGLGDMVSGLVTHPHIRKAVEAATDREGKIRDEASVELARIRKSMRSCESRIRNMLEGMLKQKDLMPYLQDLYLAERNKRLVIPLKRDFKGHIPGIVHDISNTGETLYVEPYLAQQLGNELESLRAEEKLEEYRILRTLSAQIREHMHEIAQDCSIIARIDALQAVAVFSDHMRMSPPEINETGIMKISGARHPLLWKALRREAREDSLVPMSLEAGREQSCMVITGSNAGGKTVVLKTIGVLNLMALSGMHIPADPGTTVPYLDTVLADIGDEQSIEQNLSTFSAHITRIADIIRKSSARTLVIIDEFGTGTDPEQGGALSCAVLRRLKQRGALSFVSTHLGMLKAFAHSEPGMMNAAMEMEEVRTDGISTYRPTYRLVMGEPGTSHAFEIAGSLGLDSDIISEARTFIKEDGIRIESLLTELKKRTADLDSGLQEAGKLKQELTSLRSELEAEISAVRRQKQDTLRNALREAEEIIRQTKREAREIIDRLKRSGIKEAAPVIRELDRKLEETAAEQKQLAPEEIRQLKEIREGQHVFVQTLRKYGTIRSVNEKSGRCRVRVDGKEIEVSVSELCEPPADALQGIPPADKRRDDLPSDRTELTDIKGELNVIGQRVDPALSLLERYLNDASMAGLSQVRIIHGIGSGILSRSVREYVKDHPLVRDFRKGNDDEGGDAVTVISL